MSKISVVGVDLGQGSFHVYGVDKRGQRVVARKLSRAKFLAFFAELEPCVVGMEACRGAHHWGRELRAAGHTVRLMHPKYVKAYVKTNKNDWGDAEAVCEAVQRPNMRFIPVKTLEQQSIQMLHGARSQAIKARTAKANQIRAFLHEGGVVVPRGVVQVRKRTCAIIEAHEGSWPGLMCQVLRALHEELRQLDEQIVGYDAQVKALVEQEPLCQQLMTIPGVGPLGASALVAKVGRGEEFASARHMAAWLGLVPRHWGTGGRTQLYGISKRGDAYVRTLLIHGARSALRQALRRADGRAQWAVTLAARRGHNIACVGLANKIARIAWAMLRSGENYRAAPELS